MKTKKQERKEELTSKIISSSKRINKLKNILFDFNRGYNKLTLAVSHPINNKPAEISNMEANLNLQISLHKEILYKAINGLLELCELKGKISTKELNILSTTELKSGYVVIESATAENVEPDVYYFFLNISDIIKEIKTTEEVKGNEEEINLYLHESYPVA